MKEGRSFRNPDALRKPIYLKLDVIPGTDGSAYFEIGHTKLFVSIHGPSVDRTSPVGKINCVYSMAPYSSEERVKKKVNRRSQEISLKIKQVFENIILLEKYPNSLISIFVYIISSDAGTRVAAITAISVALAYAGIRMNSLLPAISVGKYSGKILLDLDKFEDMLGEADMPLCYHPKKKEYLLLQFDGQMTIEEIEKSLRLARYGCIMIYVLQQYVLLKKFYEEMGDSSITPPIAKQLLEKNLREFIDTVDSEEKSIIETIESIIKTQK